MLKKSFILVFFAVLAASNIFAETECDINGNCSIPGSSGEKGLPVLSPIGKSRVPAVKIIFPEIFSCSVKAAAI